MSCRERKKKRNELNLKLRFTRCEHKINESLGKEKYVRKIIYDLTITHN